MFGRFTLFIVLSIFLFTHSVEAQSRRNNKGTTRAPTKPKGKDEGGKDNTTGKPDDSKCSDEGKNCKDMRGHCSDKEFEATLKKHCAMTCGHCAPPKEQCTDVAGNQCAQMKQKGFCGSSAHPVSMQRMFCAKTCDLCAK